MELVMDFQIFPGLASDSWIGDGLALDWHDLCQ